MRKQGDNSSGEIKELLILFGGGSREHEISALSAAYIRESLQSYDELNIHFIEITKQGQRVDPDGRTCELRRSGELIYLDTHSSHQIDFVIPCIHGPPGESGEIQAVFEMMGLPYLGCRPEASQICFNKVTTKLWLDALGIENAPFTFLSDSQEKSLQKAESFFNEHQSVFIKAASQGSSIGCFYVKELSSLRGKIAEAFKFSEYVLIEAPIKGRELEIAVYQYKNKIIATDPGEIISPDGFYTFEEKYDSQSQTKTQIKAKDLDTKVVEQMKAIAVNAFNGLHLRHLARVDFFLTEDHKILLNEINTFPGMTPISMFPKMMEANGHSFNQFIYDIIKNK